MEPAIWTYKDKEPSNINYRKYHMLLTTDESHVIGAKIQCFAKWKSSTNSVCTKGVVYLILGDGDGDSTVKFINNEGSVDEASVQMFDLATKKQYADQFKKLEEQPVVEEKKTAAPIVKKKAAKKK